MKKTLSNKEIKAFLDIIKKEYNLELSKKERYELFEDKEKKIILSDNKPIFFYYENRLIPTLKLILENNFLKKITIDMGAVRFIASGADVMRPGIVEIEENILKDEIVSIIDINNKKPIAIGISIFNSEEIKKLSQGKVIKTIHYVSDKIFNFTS